jgi:hypothetical protein
MNHPTLNDRITLVQSELNVALKYEKDEPQTALLHLERAKNELHKAEHDIWHSFHVSGRPY